MQRMRPLTFKFPASPRRLPAIRHLAAALAALWLSWPVAALQTEEAPLKVAFLYNFLKLAEWPAAQAADPMEVCLARIDPFGVALEALQGREVQGKALQVRVVEAGQSLAGCRLLFISAEEKSGTVRHWLAASAGQALLTVSDGPGFIGQGGMIGLVAIDNKLRFEVNLEPVHSNRLKLSAQLLQLALRVEGIQP